MAVHPEHAVAQPDLKGEPAPGGKQTRRRLGAGADVGRASVVLLLLLVVAALGGFAAWWSLRSNEHADMVRALAALADAQGTWDQAWDLHERKIASLQDDLRMQDDPMRRLVLQREIATQYVNAGKAEPAIALLEDALAAHRATLAEQDVETLEADLAFAYYRVGEQSNCATSLDASYCILPLDPAAAHRARLGAAESARRYEALLHAHAGSQSAPLYRWMLNIAAMQLGRHPDGVPVEWRIDPAVFRSEHDVGSFPEVAAARGIVEFGRAGGTILEDFDNDGHLDLMLSHMGMKEPLAYFRGKGDGRFERRSDQAGLSGLYGGLNIVQADYDNDGCIDVYVPRGAWFHDKGRIPGSLLRNQCDGTFRDVTASAGVTNGYPSQAAVWADFDGDGWLDLFVGNEIVRDKVAWPAEAADFRLYLNRRDGTFVDVAAQSGIRVTGMIKGVAVDDFDNDGRPDLYVSIMGAPNRLFRNVGGAKFVDVTQSAGVAEPVMSFTTWFFDYDNDGWPDIFVSGYSATMPNIVREILGDKANAVGERPRLYRNNRDGTFTDVSRSVGLDRLLLTMGANFGDLDNDGWLDFYLGTGAAPLYHIVPNQMFRNDAGRRFQNVTTSGGFGHLQKGHAVAFGDLDDTGVMDVVANTGGAMAGDKSYTLVFKNPGHGNHWVKLDLVGTRANRYAVGARLRIRVTNAAGGTRDIHRTVGSGGSFGASGVRPHVGLGQASAIESIEIRWPGSGEIQRWPGPIRVDRRYVLHQGDPQVHVAESGAAISSSGAWRSY